MADIELVIKIPEEAYNLLKTSGVDWLGAEHILDAVSNGTPLPKGHGDLIDRGTYCSALEERIKGWNITTIELHDKVHGIAMARNICNGLKPIIKADKESE